MPQNVESVTLGRQGRVVIPAEWRRELGLEAGARLAMRLDGRTITIETPEDILRRIQDAFASVGSDRSLADELIQERRHAAERELLDP